MAVYKFRILLDSVFSEEVFRDILIDSTDNFKDLHDTILKAFDFTGEQLSSFYISNDDWDKGEEISLMDMSFGEEEASKTMDGTLLEDCMYDARQKIILVYDFLKMWIFLIELQEVTQTSEHALPFCTVAIGDAPKEDSKESELEEEISADDYLGNFDDEFKSEFDDEMDDEVSFDNIDDYDF